MVSSVIGATTRVVMAKLGSAAEIGEKGTWGQNRRLDELSSPKIRRSSGRYRQASIGADMANYGLLQRVSGQRDMRKLLRGISFDDLVRKKVNRKTRRNPYKSPI